jgi:hypothetical protein
MEFVELPDFTKQLEMLGVPDVDYAEFQGELCQNPEKGVLIPHSGGLRKARMGFARRGKRGAARIVYLYLVLNAQIILFYLYTKSDQENLSSQQLKDLRLAVSEIKKGRK